MIGDVGLKELISGCNTAILCRSIEDVDALAEMVEAIYPGFGSLIRNQGWNVGGPRYNGNFCIRIDHFIGYNNPDIGHASKEWYVQKGRKIVSVNDIFDDNSVLDLGEIKSDDADVSVLLLM